MAGLGDREVGLGGEVAAEESLRILRVHDASEDEGAPAARAHWPRRRPRLAAAGLGAGLALAALAAVAICQGTRAPASADAGEDLDEKVVGLGAWSSMTDFLSTMQQAVKATDSAVTLANQSANTMNALVNGMSATADALGDTGAEFVDQLSKPQRFKLMVKNKIRGMNATEKEAFKEKLKKKLNITSWKQLEPEAFNLTDGNPCPDNEELHGSLCYTSCAKLTNNQYPFRTSAFTCCKHEPPCGLPGDAVSELQVCAGYDTSSAADNCPHAQGACLVNEELFAGFCYKKCALITWGVLPHRTAGASCCNTQDTFAFLNIGGGCDTDAETYSIGGGKGLVAQEPREVHQPSVAFTEASR